MTIPENAEHVTIAYNSWLVIEMRIMFISTAACTTIKTVKKNILYRDIHRFPIIAGGNLLSTICQH